MERCSHSGTPVTELGWRQMLTWLFLTVRDKRTHQAPKITRKDEKSTNCHIFFRGPEGFSLSASCNLYKINVKNSLITIFQLHTVQANGISHDTGRRLSKVTFERWFTVVATSWFQIFEFHVEIRPILFIIITLSFSVQKRHTILKEIFLADKMHTTPCSISKFWEIL